MCFIVVGRATAITRPGVLSVAGWSSPGHRERQAGAGDTGISPEQGGTPALISNMESAAAASAEIVGDLCPNLLFDENSQVRHRLHLEFVLLTGRNAPVFPPRWMCRR
jgi:hypothetical protein